MTDPVPALLSELAEAQKQADYWKGRTEAEWLEADKRGMERIREHVAETRLTEARAVADDLADVLVHMVVGWEEALGVDLAKHPEVIRVMKRYRELKESTP